MTIERNPTKTKPRRQRHRPAKPVKPRQRKRTTVVQSAIVDGDRAWLQVCAPDLVAEVDEDVQERLADMLNHWIDPDW